MALGFIFFVWCVGYESVCSLAWHKSHASCLIIVCVISPAPLSSRNGARSSLHVLKMQKILNVLNKKPLPVSEG